MSHIEPKYSPPQERSYKKASSNDINQNTEDYTQITNKSNSCLYNVAVAFAVAALIVGLVGAFSFTNHLNVGLNGVGTLSGANALYTAVGGCGVAGVTFILLAVKAIADRCQTPQLQNLVTPDFD